MLTLHVDRATRAVNLPSQAEFSSWVQAVLQDSVAQDRYEMSIRLVDRDESQALNQQYRHREAPTNVLSFPCELPAGVNVPLLGDLVICAPVVADEAVAQCKPLRSHWAHMVVHGTLHLLGYDHVAEDEAIRMEHLETEILEALGFAPPYECMDQR